MRVELHPAAEIDLLGIMEYYEQEAGPEIASDFYREFHSYANLIGEWPESFARQNPRIRRANLNRFPYHILFEIRQDNSIQILVVKHDHRNPSFGTRRR